MFHKAYAFDIDDNLLHTNCTVFVEKWDGSKMQRCEIPESELKAKLKEGRTYPKNDPEECYYNMRLGGGKLTQDLFDALDAKAYGPSWERFKLANLQASPIGIITARGHPIEDLRSAHQALLLLVLIRTIRIAFRSLLILLLQRRKFMLLINLLSISLHSINTERSIPIKKL